jgi:hypothetical protein
MRNLLLPEQRAGLSYIRGIGKRSAAQAMQSSQWTSSGDFTPWLIEGGKGMRPMAVHFQLRPNSPREVTGAERG